MAKGMRPAGAIVRNDTYRVTAGRRAEPDPHGNRAQRRAAKKRGRKPVQPPLTGDRED